MLPEVAMRPFKRDKPVVTVNEPEGSGDRRETAPGKPIAVPATPVSGDDAGMPAAWYPDPVDSASFRYWDGVAWTRLTKPVPPPAPISPGAELSPLPDGASSNGAEVPLSETPLADVETDGAEQANAEQANDNTSAGHEESADYWVREADEAVARAWRVGTPAAWRSAAQAAVVVAEIAQTMRVTSYAHQIAEQLAQTAAEAAQQAQRAQQEAVDAMRTAERTAQAAEEAARAAQVAVEMALDAKREAEQTAQASPQAMESSQLAAQAAAEATATADHLDQIVIKAREANTPEAWSEALQIAAEAGGDEDRLNVILARPVRSDPGQER